MQDRYAKPFPFYALEFGAVGRLTRGAQPVTTADALRWMKIGSHGGTRGTWTQFGRSGMQRTSSVTSWLYFAKSGANRASSV